MVVRKSPEEIMWDSLMSLSPADMKFNDAVKWARSIIRYIKTDIDRAKIEHCLFLLEELVVTMQKWDEYVCDAEDECCDELTEAQRATFFDIVLSYSGIKEKYDRKEEMLKQKNKISKRLERLEKKLEDGD